MLHNENAHAHTFFSYDSQEPFQSTYILRFDSARFQNASKNVLNYVGIDKWWFNKY